MIDFILFRRSIRLLRDQLFSDLVDSLESLQEHSEVINKEHEVNSENLRMLVMKYKQREKQMEIRKEKILHNDIQPKIPLLKKNQQSPVSSSVTKTIVLQIMEARKEIENINFSLEELKLRLHEHAKRTKETYNAVKIRKEKIRLLEAAIEIQGFLNMHGYKVDEIADFEIEKYFTLYKGAGIDG